jgi:plastocyanin
MRKYSVFLLILIVCMAIICGCSVPSSPSTKPAAPAATPTAQSATPASNGPVVKVSIIASSFDPAIVNVKVGTTVKWTNEDRIVHHVEHLPVLPSDKLLFQSEPLYPGDSFSYTFSEPGRYKYSDPQQAGGRTALVIVE